MSADLIILGAGGNSLGIVDAVEAAHSVGRGQFRIIGILDDLQENQGRRVYGYPVLGSITRAAEYQGCLLVNGISSVASFRKRAEIVARCRIPTERFATVIHPSASVSPHAKVGPGSVILANSVVCADAILDEHVLVLQGSTVNHHTHIGRHATISAGVTILGYVDIGESAFVGGGASLAPYTRIGALSLVGMGAVVIRNVAEGVVVAGNPAHEISESRHAAAEKPRRQEQ